MRVLLTGFSASASIFKFILLFIVFIAILVAAYYFTRWYAKSGFVKKGSNNIKIVESYQLAPGKMIYIVKIGNKFVSIMTSKDNIVKLTELSESGLEFQEININDTSFKEVMGQMMKKRNMKDNKK